MVVNKKIPEAISSTVRSWYPGSPSTSSQSWISYYLVSVSPAVQSKLSDIQINQISKGLLCYKYWNWLWTYVLGHYWLNSANPFIITILIEVWNNVVLVTDSFNLWSHKKLDLLSNRWHCSLLFASLPSFTISYVHHFLHLPAVFSCI